MSKIRFDFEGTHRVKLVFQIKRVLVPNRIFGKNFEL